MPTLTFTNGDDSYVVTAAGTYDLTFLAGNDTLIVNGGTFTTAHMGDGNDVIDLRVGDAFAFGEAGADRFEIRASGIEASGGDGNDLFNLRGGSSQSVTGGTGNDRFNFYAATTLVTLHGGDGADDFYGYNHAITGTVYGATGNDTFTLFRGAVLLQGGPGNDVYRADATSPANFFENPNEGVDTVQVARGRDHTLAANIDNISVQTLSGSLVSDATLNGNAIANVIIGHVNNETMDGLGGNDTLSGKSGADLLTGGAGNDRLDGGSDNDQLLGGEGNDVLQGRTGDDLMTGGLGDDTYYVDSNSDSVTENAAEGTDLVRVTTIFDAINGYFEYWMPFNVENAFFNGTDPTFIHCNGLDNLIIGTAQSDLIIGDAGNDTLKGAASNDNLVGGDGNDILDGGTGGDTLQGNLGDDTYYIDNAGDFIDNEWVGSGGGGTDTVFASLAAYTLPTDIENGSRQTAGALTGNILANLLAGSSGDDTLNGGSGNDTINGGGGNDALDGSSGDDSIKGGAGNDTLSGGGENDVLTGGGGADTISGGTYGDVFAYTAVTDSSDATGVDLITDFEGETFDLSGIDANTGLAGDQAFAWGNTTAAAHSVWVVFDVPGHFFIYADVNGNTVADLAISVTHASGAVGEFTFVL